MYIDPISKKLLHGSGENQAISLMYHSVSNKKITNSSPWVVSLPHFINQLDLLLEYGWTTVCASQFISIEQLPPKTVAITFDDGFANNIHAFDELVKRNMLASWFIVTHDIGKVSSWTDSDTSPSRLLDNDQLLAMQAAGMEIGSHTLSHCRLTQVSSKQIKNELIQSRESLEVILNRTVTSFAYPYGLYNTSILNTTKSAGYQVAFTTRTGFGLVNKNPLEVRRVTIFPDDSLSTFARKLAFADNDVSWSKIGHYGISRIQSRLNF